LEGFLRREQTFSKYLIMPHYRIGRSVRNIDAEKPGKEKRLNIEMKTSKLENAC